MEFYRLRKNDYFFKKNFQRTIKMLLGNSMRNYFKKKIVFDSKFNFFKKIIENIFSISKKKYLLNNFEY